MENEIWLPIPNYENDYEVSSFGRVRSLKFGKLNILKMSVDGRGYYNVALCKNGKPKTITVHKLASLAFLGERPNGFDVNHKDSNKQNNALLNLEYISTRDNIAHGKTSMQKENK